MIINHNFRLGFARALKNLTDLGYSKRFDPKQSCQCRNEFYPTAAKIAIHVRESLRRPDFCSGRPPGIITSPFPGLSRDDAPSCRGLFAGGDDAPPSPLSDSRVAIQPLNARPSCAGQRQAESPRPHSVGVLVLGPNSEELQASQQPKQCASRVMRITSHSQPRSKHSKDSWGIWEGVDMRGG